MSMLISVGLGFAALSVDLSWIRLSLSGSQAIADAAANAALLELRRTGDPDLAAEAAEEFVVRNAVGRDSPELISIQFGDWDEENLVFEVDGNSPHAARAIVGRPNDKPLELFFAKSMGFDSMVIEQEAIAATRSMHVVLVMDITGSFASDIHHARAAALDFLSLLSATHGKFDKIGMVLFYHRFGVEYTAMTYLDTESDSGTAQANWEKIDTASKPSWSYFDSGGRHPDMPREYYDEYGTDHSVGVEMALKMFEENPDPFAFKAMVMLTDGRPSTLPYNDDRDRHGYSEERWRVHEGPVPHPSSAIRAATLDAAQRAWEEHEVNVWTVSYVAQEQFLMDMTKGVGKFYYTDDPTQLGGIFSEIASSLPIATVK
jgi:hypothetical protein